jgi:hypothetical protein
MKKEKAEAIAMAESAVSTLKKFIDSIEVDEIKSGAKVLGDGGSPKILAMLPIMITLQALVADDVIEDKLYAELMTRMITDQKHALSAAVLMNYIHIQRLNGEDFFDGKEI